jgi:hypothetical protein
MAGPGPKASALPRSADQAAIGRCLKRAWQVDQSPSFDDFLRAIDVVDQDGVCQAGVRPAKELDAF